MLAFDKDKQMTIYEKIQSMSLDEMSKFLMSIRTYDDFFDGFILSCKIDRSEIKMTDIYNWLQKEVEK